MTKPPYEFSSILSQFRWTFPQNSLSLGGAVCWQNKRNIGESTRSLCERRSREGKNFAQEPVLGSTERRDTVTVANLARVPRSCMTIYTSPLLLPWWGEGGVAMMMRVTIIQHFFLNKEVDDPRIEANAERPKIAQKLTFQEREGMKAKQTTTSLESIARLLPPPFSQQLLALWHAHENYRTGRKIPTALPQSAVLCMLEFNL